MKCQIISILIYLICLSCNLKEVSHSKNDSADHPAKNIWQINSINTWAVNEGLLNVESIIYDKENHVFYATNGLNYKEGTDGFISKISATGHMEDLKWVAGLNRPTGMTIFDSLLYVADVNTLLSINIKNGNIIDRFKEPMENAGLNDVAISHDGSVYVTASFLHSVFRLEGNELSLWAQDEEKLQWANGIIAMEDELVVGGMHLCSIDKESKKITQLSLDPIIVDFDGLAADGMGGYFVTTVENSSLFHIDHQHRVAKLVSEDIYFGDLTYNQDNQRLYIPRGKKSTNEYFISILHFSM